MSSIYRPDQPASKPNLRRQRQGDVSIDAQSEWAGRRKAQPANVILPLTRRWINSIPTEFRPQTLPIRFGRIANLLAATWDNPKECTAYISSLLHDDRGGRQGFPPEVMQDLRDLRVYYAALHPLVVWDQDPDPKR
jgi:hypothetical protein